MNLSLRWMKGYIDAIQKKQKNKKKKEKQARNKTTLIPNYRKGL